jgi:hypothetical protein
MSANFLDKRAKMFGLDDHLYLCGPPNGPPIPKSDHPHAAFCEYSSFDNGKHTTTVTSEGEYMLPADWEKKVLPHLPVPVPLPHLAELALVAVIIAAGTSKSRLKASTVTGQGRALTCCVLSSVGWSANCSGSGVLYQSNSVVTSPTAGDYIEMAVGYALDKFLGRVVDRLLKGVPEPFKSLLGKGIDLIKDPIVDFAKEKARELVDDTIVPEINEHVPKLEKLVDELL